MSPTKRKKAQSATPQSTTKTSISSKVWGWIKGGVLLAAGGVAGFAANYWIDYRSDYRSALQAQMESFAEVASPVADDLRTFFLIAQGQRQKSESDIEALRKSLYASVVEAQLLISNIGGNDQILAAYQQASTDLQNASMSVTGPLDAKPLIQAANDYLLAQQKLQEAAQVSYKSVL